VQLSQSFSKNISFNESEVIFSRSVSSMATQSEKILDIAKYSIDNSTVVSFIDQACLVTKELLMLLRRW